MLTGGRASGPRGRVVPDRDHELPAGRRFRWEDLNDGRLHRLRRGVDYTGSIKALAEDAQHSAMLLGKLAATYKEELGRHESLWVQFLEGHLQPGRPCSACGGRILLREQGFFLRCRRCGSLYALRVPDPEHGEARAQAARLKAIVRGKFRMPDDERFPLSAYSEIAFHASHRRQRREHFFGRAVDPEGAPVLLWARCLAPPPVSGRPETAAAAGPEVSTVEWRVARLPVAPYGGAIRLDRPPLQTPSAIAGEGEGPPIKRARRLHDLERVALVHKEHLPGRERLFGHAVDAEVGPTFIYVDYPLVNGGRVEDPELPGAEVHTVYHWPAYAFGSMIDLAALAG